VDPPDVLLARAAEHGFAALALTDTNNLYGAVAFVEAARRFGVRPILGACLRHGGRHCTALIAEPSGYRSLCRVLSRLNLEADPSLTDLLGTNAEGLHVLAEEETLLTALHDAYGPRLWLEVVRPAPVPARQRAALDRARQLGVRPVASVAAHFARPEGHDMFRLLAAVRQGTLLDRQLIREGEAPPSLKRERKVGAPFAHASGSEEVTAAHHLADTETVYQRFRDLPEAVVNAQELGKQCRADVLPHGVILPSVGPDALGRLRDLGERGLRRRAWQDTGAARRRWEQELEIIAWRGLAGYFLIVHEIAAEARRRGYPMALRGSAGNSLACYLLGITDVDPLRFDLPLERFLHLARPDLPDIDLDFDWKVRDDILAWVFDRFGAAHTAMVSSHLFLQPKSAFREAAKAHGLSNEQVSGLLETLDARVDHLEAETDGPLARVPRAFPLEPDRWPRLLADARRLLGRPHHLSIHPGGVVVTLEPIESYAPLQRSAKGVVITQFEKDAVEAVGLVKIDLLGNRALSTVREALRLAAAGCPTRRPVADGDPATVALLCRGDTLGVGQLESPAMRHLLIQMQPRGMDDVIQALALIRPGAASVGAKERFIRRRRGLEPVTYPHPSLEPLLRETCGLMLYEDDALGVVQALTGFSPPEADRFRKLVTKGGTDEELAALSKGFLTACVRNEVPRAVAEAMWVQLAKFNAYSFCKSHAVSYGLIAWEAASLKTHHPLAFWTAALNNNQGMYPLRVYVEAVKRAGIPLLLPCVNCSWRHFVIEGNAIRTGLASIRGLGDAVLDAVLADRDQHGPYTGLTEFLRRVQAGPEAVSALIQVGAFDFTGASRSTLMLEAALDGTRPEPQALFPDADSDLPWCPDAYSQSKQRKEEWDRLSFLVGPPLMSLFRPKLPAGLHDSRSVPRSVGRRVRLAGLVAAARHTPTKHGDDMQFVTLEDEWGFVEVTLFPGTCPPVAYLAMGPYLVEGKVENHYGVATVEATRFEKVGS
jgi:DNA-directed DNA polymerase III PolC